MNNHPTYEPRSAFMKWLERRLPIGALIHSSLVAYPTPRNLNYWWTFGGILTFMLGVQMVTGIVLAMHYVPHVDYAFNSVEHIMRDVNYGWLLRYIHASGASFFFVTGFVGYVLPWGQMSFWAATVITNLFSAIPVIGNSIVTWLWGGFAVGDPTLNRFYALHYLLPFVIVAFVGFHLAALHRFGSNNPTGIDIKGDTIPFHPYYTVKDLFGLAVFMLVYAW